MGRCSCVILSSMKPLCRRILITYKRSSLFGFQIPIPNHSSVINLSVSRFKLHGSKGIHTCKSTVLRLEAAIDPKLGFRNVLLKGCPIGGIDRKFSRLVSKVASDYRNHSTSVESHVNDMSWEKFYIKGRLNVNVKPLVIEEVERKDEDEDKVHLGKNVGIGKDHTIFSLIDGLVKLGPDRKKVRS
ncbi:hypothetical protein L1887_38353 [Cichorium endivia]|nr:hypothetical protein L1887_38353 [Cichorium endivia]